MDAKVAAQQRLHELGQALAALSRRIHAHPELGYEEEKACTWLSEFLDGQGMTVERNTAGLETAFAARVGSGPLHVAICAEYDALPGIGHACGHNLIAAMAAGAGAALAPFADDAGLTVTVLGTPAEEVGNVGGKILMLERGAFAGQHAAMMVHPAPFDFIAPKIIAAALLEVRYQGKEAHASAFPELGINAGDALTVAQVSLGLLRQHLRPSDRIHGITTHGGEAANIIPAHTAARYFYRAATLDDLEELRVKVVRCFEAGALATGSRLELTGGEKPYAHMVHDAGLAELYRANAAALGRSFAEAGPAADRAAASTDMGNVSLVLPAIHPFIGIDSLPAVNHQPEFTACCIRPPAEQALHDGALAMAWTALDAARDPALCRRLLARSR